MLPIKTAEITSCIYVRAGTLNSLETAVNDRVDEGWTPQGAVFTHGTTLCQRMLQYSRPIVDQVKMVEINRYTDVVSTNINNFITDGWEVAESHPTHVLLVKYRYE